MASNAASSSSATATTISFTLNGTLCARSSPMEPDQLLGTLRYTHSPSMSKFQQSQYVQDAEHDIEIYEGYIEQLHALCDRHIDKLRAKQAALRRNVALYTGIDSSIRKFSPEILRLIFGFAVDTNIFGGYSRQVWTSPAFTLSSVCRRWRDITLAAPELWADMKISLEARAIPPVKLALERSREYPLNLKLHTAYTADDDEEKSALALSDILKVHVGRWRSLGLEDVSASFVDEICSPDLIASALAHLTSSLVEGQPIEAPNIRSIEFYEYDGRDDLENLSISPTVRHLTLPFDHQENLDTLSKELKECAGLESFCLIGRAVGSEGRPYVASALDLDDHIRTVIHIQSLEVDLRVAGGFYPVLHDLFQTFILPSLSSLSITFNPGVLFYRTDAELKGVWPRGPLNDCLARSSCSLTTLSLCGIPLTESDLISLFRRTPSLHTLTLEELAAVEPGTKDASKRKPSVKRTVTKSFLNGLQVPTLSTSTFADVQHPLLPKLTSLTVTVQHHFDADDAFVDMVKSRWADRGIRTVVLYVLGRELSREPYEPLKKMDREGLMVSVFGSNRERIV